MIQWLIVALAFGGLVISLYFTLAYYGRIRKARWVPEILCAREGSSCVTVVQTPYARVFGVPNSVLGIVYYSLLIVWASGHPWPRWYFVGFTEYLVFVDFTSLTFLASILTVFVGFYLIYALRRILHIDCPLCYAAHGINLAILVLFVLLSFPYWLLNR